MPLGVLTVSLDYVLQHTQVHTATAGASSHVQPRVFAAGGVERDSLVSLRARSTESTT